MAEIRQTNDFDDEETYSLASDDPLGVLSTTLEVVEEGEYVWIDTGRVEKLAQQWILLGGEGTSAAPTWYERYHFNDGTERTVNWIVVLDALNFSFWAEKGQPRWCIEYHAEKLNGYLAEAA